MQSSICVEELWPGERLRQDRDYVSSEVTPEQAAIALRVLECIRSVLGVRVKNQKKCYGMVLHVRRVWLYVLSSLRYDGALLFSVEMLGRIAGLARRTVVDDLKIIDAWAVSDDADLSGLVEELIEFTERAFAIAMSSERTCAILEGRAVFDREGIRQRRAARTAARAEPVEQSLPKSDFDQTIDSLIERGQMMRRQAAIDQKARIDAAVAAERARRRDKSKRPAPHVWAA